MAKEIVIKVLPQKRFSSQKKSKKREIFIILVTIILSVVSVRGVENLIPYLKAKISPKEPCPQGMVFVPSPQGGFCIDKYENSPGPNCPFLNPQNQVQTRENLNTPGCIPVSQKDAFPWTFISRDQAERACAKAGKRLPTSQEWYLAALGTPDKSENWTKDDCQVAENWSEQPGKTGSAKNCVSPFGAYDMIGNVWEWVQETVDKGIFESRELPEKGYVFSTDGKGMPALTDPEKPNPDYNEDYFWIYKEGKKAIARGGYWNNQSKAGIYSVYIAHFPFQGSSGVGFRCAK